MMTLLRMSEDLEPRTMREIMAKPKDELLNHDYDGIQEYDNDLPTWWIWLFYITIIFAFVYLLHYHVIGTGVLQDEKYMKQMNPNATNLAMYRPPSLMEKLLSPYRSPWHSKEPEWTPHNQFAFTGSEDEELQTETDRTANLDTSLEPITDEARIAAGKRAYDQFCFTCHGLRGEGGIGPNLTDVYWINGGSFPEIVYTIQKGVPIKGMIAWERQLSQEDILNVASYVHTLLGTEPSNGKAPQGEEYVPQEMEDVEIAEGEAS
ncbi:c-type cytochrome [bacterium]|nr:c-type cytochrome [bacterium]